MKDCAFSARPDGCQARRLKEICDRVAWKSDGKATEGEGRPLLHLHILPDTSPAEDAIYHLESNVDRKHARGHRITHRAFHIQACSSCGRGCRPGSGAPPPYSQDSECARSLPL